MRGQVRNEILGDLCAALDRFGTRLSRVPCVSIVDEMIRQLAAFHDSAARMDALPQFRTACETHPLHGLVLQDPFTALAFHRSNGQVGDGAMLDCIHRPRLLSLSDIGAAVHFVTTGTSVAGGLRWRRDHLAGLIVKTMKRKRNARILSVASGHLRELDLVRCMTDRRDCEIMALDPHEASLAEAVNANADFNVVPLNKPVSSLLRGEVRASYDLIHAAGTLDTLSDEAASALLRRLIAMLAPSGQLIVGNHAPGNYGRGYMEGMMGWVLRYRTEAALARLLPRGTKRRMYRDKPGATIYLDIPAPGV